MNTPSLKTISYNKDFTSNNDPLAIIIIGASGDLAKRKIYPSLFSLFQSRLLPANTIIFGFGRADFSREALSKKVLPFISGNEVGNGKNQMMNEFFSMCYYQRGRGYDDEEAFLTMHKSISQHHYGSNGQSQGNVNCLFFMAIPANIFATATTSITRSFVHPDPTKCRRIPSESVRFLFEKPFGSDTKSYIQLSNALLKVIKEQQIYRIDHYLGKDMIRCIPSFRFKNSWARAIWNRKHVSHVIISVKETIGIHGRGGYFEQYGIIRDIMQNHLLQVMCLVAMEEPVTNDSTLYSGVEAMRDAKCSVLKSIRIPQCSDCIIGQYEGYKMEDMVGKDSRTPTFAAVKLFVDNDRWLGVPFILLAGKALEENSVDVQIVFTRPKSEKSFARERVQNELKIKIQPENHISLTTHVQENGLHSTDDRVHAFSPSMDLDLSKLESGPSLSKLRRSKKDDAYSKLIKDSLQGISSSFVRDDELRLSWQIFTPLLHQLEHVNPFPYKFGSKGPLQAQHLLDMDVAVRSKL